MVSNTTPEKDQLATQLQVVSGRGTISAQSGERNNQNKCEVSPAQSSWHVTGFKRGGGGGSAHYELGSIRPPGHRPQCTERWK